MDQRGAVAEVFLAPEDKAAPDTINAEVLQTIRAHERSGGLDTDAADEARRAFMQLPITRYPTLTLLERAWELRHNFTAYDAMYVALAEAIGTKLVTTDSRLARATREHTAIRVEVLGTRA